MIRKHLASVVGVALLVLCCSGVQAANTSPNYKATLKLGKGNVAAGSTITIQGGGFDFYSLLSLSAKDTGKGKASVPVTMNEQVAVYTSNANSGTLTTNANATIVFFSTSNSSVITTNGNTNTFPITYTVKVSNKGVVTAKSFKTKSVTFTAVQGVASKNKFKFVFSGAQVDAGVAKLPLVTKGKNQVPAFGDTKAGTGITGFTLKLGSATFVGTFSKGKIVF